VGAANVSNDDPHGLESLVGKGGARKAWALTRLAVVAIDSQIGVDNELTH
jgi:hypothetical protein